MGIYSKQRAKITIGTVLISLGIIVGLWLLLFVTDYILFTNDKPMLFSISSVEEVEDKHITIEKGLGYYVITNEQNTAEMYVFGKRIK